MVTQTPHLAWKYMSLKQWIYHTIIHITTIQVSKYSAHQKNIIIKSNSLQWFFVARPCRFDVNPKKGTLMLWKKLGSSTQECETPQCRILLWGKANHGLTCSSEGAMVFLVFPAMRIFTKPFWWYPMISTYTFIWWYPPLGHYICYRYSLQWLDPAPLPRCGDWGSTTTKRSWVQRNPCSLSRAVLGWPLGNANAFCKIL